MLEISNCRICGGSEFELVVDLGWQALSGIFPRNPNRTDFPGGPLRLLRCTSTFGCGLVQLDRNFDQTILYGETYGYRSGLNPSMVAHLKRRIADVMSRVNLNHGDVVIDIGSNDGTTLGFYPPELTRIGIDPTSQKFGKSYPVGAISVPEFFSAKVALETTAGSKSKVITSFSMFYDLEDPQKFVNEVASVLASDGIWILEQSYLPLMLSEIAFDTICHEHLEYYGIRQIDWLLERANLEIVDIELNKVNGGSIAICAAHKGRFQISESVSQARIEEQEIWSHNSSAFSDFAHNVAKASQAIRGFVHSRLAANETIAALGASTKGNVLLQYVGLTNSEISAIGEVNPEKFGCETPGSWIPIQPQDAVLQKNHDYYIVLPWHFRDFFLTSPVFADKTLVFPLPHLAIVRR